MLFRSLEQRISRVHRLGQKRSVRVINLVAERTIEHSMLSSYRFKRSMFSGVLDGGEDQVFMEGGRLNQFMKTVEQTATSLGEKSAMGQGENCRSAIEEISESDTGGRQLIDLGVSVLTRLIQGFLSGGRETRTSQSQLFQVKKDAATGKQVLQFPLPDKEKQKKLADALTLLKEVIEI